MASERDRTTDSLLHPGRGHTPSYGITDSSDEKEEKAGPGETGEGGVTVAIRHAQERVWTVAVFSLIACLASVVIGMSLGYSTNTLSELSDVWHGGDRVYGIENGTFTASLFGVRHIIYRCLHIRYRIIWHVDTFIGAFSHWSLHMYCVALVTPDLSMYVLFSTSMRGPFVYIFSIYRL